MFSYLLYNVDSFLSMIGCKHIFGTNKIKTSNIYTIFTACKVLIAILYVGTRREAHDMIIGTPINEICTVTRLMLL